MARHYHMSRVELYKKLDDNTWDTNSIVLDDATDIEVKRGVGKVKDTFKFKVSNANDKLTRRYYSGDGSTTQFTLLYPPPTSFLGTDKFQVWVDGELATYNASPSDATEYSVSGTTLAFGAAPSSGTDNIEVRFEVISADDKVAIWLWQDKEWSSMSDTEKDTAFQIEGTITEPRLIANDTRREIEVRGVGIIEAIFGALAFVRKDYSSSSKKWYELVQDVIASLNRRNPSDKWIYGGGSFEGAATEWSNLGNPTKKSDGSDFPDVQYSTAYKRAIEIIEELTSDSYTGDGQYVYWVKRDSNGRYGFYVRYKDPNVTSGNEITQGVEPMEIKASRSTDEVINAVIYNCGFDPAGNGMEYLNYNPASQSSLGSKWKYITTTAGIGDELINAEFKAHPDKFDKTPDGHRKSNFPNDYDSDGNGYWEFQFVPHTSMQDRTYSSSAAKAVDSDEEWIDEIRLEAYWQGHDRTDRIIKLYSNPRYEATFTIYQSNSESLGSAYHITLPSFGLHNAHPLRLSEIKSTFWETTLTFEEDETVAALQ